MVTYKLLGEITNWELAKNAAGIMRKCNQTCLDAHKRLKETKTMEETEANKENAAETKEENPDREL
jgi:hypothetical protein